MSYIVRTAPGCGPLTTISRHYHIDEAVEVARASDRRAVAFAGRPEWIIWQPPRRNHPRLGAGRYGEPPRPGEPSLRKCVAEAKRALEEF